MISWLAMLYPYLITRWRQRAELFPTGQYYAHVYPHDGAREQNYFPMGGVIPIFHHMMAPESRFFFFFFFPNGLCYTCIWPQDGAREENYFPMVGVIPVFDHKMETVVFFSSGWWYTRIWPQNGAREQDFPKDNALPHLTTGWRLRAELFPNWGCYTRIL